MNKSDFERFLKLMVATAEMYDRPLSKEKIALYFTDLCDLDVRAVEYALAEHRKGSEFFPRVSQIRDLAKLWRRPAVTGPGERKQLETREMQEEKRLQNLQRVRELLAGVEKLDAEYGTTFSQSPDMEARRRELERQKEMIL